MITILLESAIFVSAGLLVMYGFFLLGRKLIAHHKMRTSVTPLQAKNLTKEKKFLDELLADIRVNTSEWIIIDDAVNIGCLIANDKKSIGIIYGGGGTSTTILLNLDKLFDGFDKNYEDTVKISMQGEHVKRFLQTAENLIDKRGKEISFFEKELKRRL